MFDGMPDQFYQFLAARAGNNASPPPPPLPNNSLPLSFSLHHNHGSSYQPTFDPSPYSQPPITHLLSHHHPQLPPLHLHLKNGQKDEAPSVLPSELHHQIHTNWSNDEVLALLRIRSSLDNNWFPADITWENVSRKLGELGFKRSAEKCKDKFEEETRSFNSSINHANNNNCSTKNNITTTIQSYSLFGELEDLCNNHHQHQHQHQQDGNNEQQHCPPPSPPSPQAHDHHSHHQLLSKRSQSPSRQLNYEQKEEEEEEDKVEEEEKEENSVDDDSEKTEENTKRLMRKRKRHKKFEMFKGFCESIVSKMMAQQEQLHSKILQDMIKRDEAKIAREETWKKQEIEKIQREMKVRAHELTIATHRQAKILAFFDKFNSSPTNFSLESQSLVEAIQNLLKLQNASSQDSITSSCTTHDPNPSFLVTQNMNLPNRVETSKVAIVQASQNPNEIDNSLPTHKSSGSLDHTSTNAPDHKPPEDETKPKPNTENCKDNDIGRRWPKDEVLALINTRCSLFNNEADHESRDQSSIKGIPLWERISQKMIEMGYKRSAKRCKEKWENINKYFRKTKDLNKKRSIDSRTCPYFHQLSHLYNQGTFLGTSESGPQVNHLPPGSPETRPVSGAQGGGSTKTANGATTTTATAAQCDEGSSVVQVPALDFEF